MLGCFCPLFHHIPLTSSVFRGEHAYFLKFFMVSLVISKKVLGKSENYFFRLNTNFGHLNLVSEHLSTK